MFITVKFNESTLHPMRSITSFILKKKKGIFSLSLPHFINISVGILTLPIIISHLPISDYGQWQFLLALQSWGLVLSAQQITDGSKRGLAMGQDGTFFYALFKRAKFLCVSSLLLLLLALYFFYTERPTLTFLSGLSSIYLFSNILIQTSIAEYFIAKKDFYYSGIWEILSSPIARIGSSIIVFFTQSIFYFVLFQIIYALTISFIALCILIAKKNLWRAYKQKNYDTSCLTYGIRFMLINILDAVSNRIIEIFIAIFFGFSNLAFFSVARDIRNQIANMLKIVSPLFYADFVKQPFEKVVAIMRKHFLEVISLSTFLGVLGTGFGVMYITYFLPTIFQTSIPLLLILSLAFPIGISTILFSTLLNSHFSYKAIAAASIIPDLIEIILIIILGLLWGITGMTIAVTLFGFVSFGFYYLATIKQSSFKKFLEQNKLIRIYERFIETHL